MRALVVWAALGVGVGIGGLGAGVFAGRKVAHPAGQHSRLQCQRGQHVELHGEFVGGGEQRNRRAIRLGLKLDQEAAATPNAELLFTGQLNF